LRFIKSVFLLFASRVSVVAANFLLIPVYLSGMSQSVVGLMTLLAALIAATTIFDFGISTKATVLAAAHRSDSADNATDVFLRYGEIAYWTIGIGISTLIFLLLILVPNNWVWQLLNEDTSLSIAVGSALLFALQILYGWLQNYYLAVLIGLQAIKPICISQLALSVMRFLLVATCIQFTKSLFLVLLSHLICTALQIFYSRYLFDKYISRLNEKPVPSKIFRNLQSLGNRDLAVIGVLAIFLTYADKIWLSFISSPSEYAIYSIAAMLASGLYLFISPVNANLVPYFVKILAKNDEKELKAGYIFATEIIAAFLVPSAMILIFFANEILSLWLGNVQVATQVSHALPWLAMGVLVNAFLTVAYALQIAVGWTKLALHMNLAASIFILPSLWVCFTVFGIVGAAMNWAFLNVALLIFWPAMMHKKIIPHFLITWLVRHFLVPCFVVASLVAPASFFLKNAGLSDTQEIFFIAFIYATAFLISVLLSCALRQRIRDKLGLILNKRSF
jgi:O-antigen/teichoic acid export membrane protein